MYYDYNNRTYSNDRVKSTAEFLSGAHFTDQDIRNMSMSEYARYRAAAVPSKMLPGVYIDSVLKGTSAEKEFLGKLDSMRNAITTLPKVYFEPAKTESNTLNGTTVNTPKSYEDAYWLYVNATGHFESLKALDTMLELVTPELQPAQVNSWVKDPVEPKLKEVVKLKHPGQPSFTSSFVIALYLAVLIIGLLQLFGVT